MSRLNKFFGKKKREIKRLEGVVMSTVVELNQYKEELQKLDEKCYWEGATLRMQPLEPEYLGFEETVVKDGDDLTTGRIYHKDGINIMRPFNSEKWMLLSSDKKIQTPFDAKTMFHAITFLEMIGMNISVKSYLSDGEEESKEMEFDI
jgi:hypothetical protein